jgi:hypothetical protein
MEKSMSGTENPATKPADDLEALMGAIDRLQNVIMSMGTDAEVAEIKLKPSRRGRYEVERALKSSPSYMNLLMFQERVAQQPSVICEVLGVKVTAT